MSALDRLDPAASPEATAVWNDVVGPKYRAHERLMVAAASAHSDVIWSRFPVERHEHVVDVGCGFGDTSARLAAQARMVTGIDCAAPLLDEAASRYAHLENVTFVLADAGRYTPSSSVEACFSRFGLMFFERPVQALKHLHGWLAPAAPLGALVWRSRKENPWLEVARRAVLEVLPEVQEGAPSCGPGPFSMSDPELVEAQLTAAGFHDVRLEPVDAEVSLGADVEEAIALQLALGPAGEIVRHAREQRHPGLGLARDRLREALRLHEGPEGVTLPSGSWWVTARA